MSVDQAQEKGEGTNDRSVTSENRPTQCVYTDPSTHALTTSPFAYGADGLRHSAAITANGTTTTTSYVLDGDNAVQEQRSDLSYATYLTGPRGPECRVDETGAGETGFSSTIGTSGGGFTAPRFQRGPTKWYVFDGLGSVVAEGDPTGTVTASSGYDVYGNVRSRAGMATTSHGFVGSLGHMSEANTGLVYMRARYYDPTVGRFASEDRSKNGVNWYEYCQDSPANMVDGAGKQPQWLGRMVNLAYTLLSRINGDTYKMLWVAHLSGISAVATMAANQLGAVSLGWTVLATAMAVLSV